MFESAILDKPKLKIWAVQSCKTASAHNQKVEVIDWSKPPKTKKQLRTFLGMTNHHHDLWQRQSHILMPPTSSVGGKGNTFEWTKEHQDVFEEMKRVIGKETPLACPDFAKPFHVFTDASDHQTGTVITQEGKPLAFHSHQMNAAQKWCTMEEQELLFVAEALEEFRTSLFGQDVAAHINHETTLHGDSANNRIAHRQPPTEECQPENRHVAGKGNAVADTLSCMEANFCPSKEGSNLTWEQEQEGLVCVCALAQLTKDEGMVMPSANELEPAFAFASEDGTHKEKIPASPQLTTREQRKCRKARHFAKESLQDICKQSTKGVKLLTCKQKMITPQSLQQRVASWHHMHFQHPGCGQMLRALQQNCWWKTMQNDVRKHVCTHRKCQLCKGARKKHGSPLVKEAEEAAPWNYANVDLVGPWTVKAKNDTFESLKLNIIDLATGWFESAEALDAKAATASEAFDHKSLSGQPQPQHMGHDGAKTCSRMIINHDLTPG